MNGLQHRLSFVLLGLCSCATTRIVVERENGWAADARMIANSLAWSDAVFLGEVHDSDRGHELQLAIVEEFAAKGRPVVISMEMFERDVQGKVDAYLAGLIAEEEFLKSSRPWPNYAAHYRSIVELAKAKGMRLVAANVPRTLAAKVGREGVAAAAADPNAASTSTAPKDAYWHEFQRAIAGDDPGAAAAIGEAALYRMYVAQCLKDDTMAESIAKILATRSVGGMRPLVVHLCGSFHSDRGYGTVARLKARLPDAKVGVVSMIVRDNPRAPLSYDERTRGDFVVVVSDGDKEERKAKQTKQDSPKHPPMPGSNPHQVATKNPHAVPASKPHELTSQPSKPSTAVAGEDTGERPGLGLMPDYESGGLGMAVASVREDGPAAAAGMLAGDTVIRLAGEEVTDARSYMVALGKLRVGQTIAIEVLRDGKSKQLEAKVGVSRR